MLESQPSTWIGNFWLVVWNMNLIFHFIYGMSSFPLSPSLFRGVGQPPTRYSASSSSPGHTPKPTWGPTGPRVTFGFPMGVLQLIHPSEHTNILDFNLGFPIRSDHLIYDDLRMQNLAAFRSWMQEACGLEYCNCRSRWPAFEQDSGDFSWAALLGAGIRTWSRWPQRSSCWAFDRSKPHKWLVVKALFYQL